MLARRALCVPVGFNASVSNMSGVAITPSIVTTQTGTWCQLAFSRATAPQLVLQNAVDCLFAAGDIGFTTLEFEVDASGIGLGGIDPQRRRTLASGTEIVQGGPRNAAYDADIPGAYSGIGFSPDITFDAAETTQTAYTRVYLLPSKAISFTMPCAISPLSLYGLHQRVLSKDADQSSENGAPFN